MFGCICAGRPVQTNLRTYSETQFTFDLPPPSTFNHLVVFLLDGGSLPPTHGATVYIRFPGSGEFQVLGAISTHKPSAVFRVKDASLLSPPPATTTIEGGGCTLGISIEPAEEVERQLVGVGAGALVPIAAAKMRPDTKVLAKRIIGNAFNYLGSFAKDVGVGEDVVPMRAFREWWSKFEARVERDPGFLERDED